MLFADSVRGTRTEAGPKASLGNSVKQILHRVNGIRTGCSGEFVEPAAKRSLFENSPSLARPKFIPTANFLVLLFLSSFVLIRHLHLLQILSATAARNVRPGQFSKTIGAAANQRALPAHPGSGARANNERSELFNRLRVLNFDPAPIRSSNESRYRLNKRKSWY